MTSWATRSCEYRLVPFLLHFLAVSKKSSEKLAALFREKEGVEDPYILSESVETVPTNIY